MPVWPASPRGRMLLVAAPIVATALVYLPTLGHDFVWLDHGEIVEGRLIVDRLAEIVEIFLDDRNYPAYHRPVYNLLHSLDRALWGTDPSGFHLTSVLLHLVNLGLLGILLRAAGASPLGSAAVVALWGLHPVNTAAVGLVHAKADLFVAACLLGALCLLVFVLRGDGWRAGPSAAALSLFAIGLFTKETAFLFPLALLCLSWTEPFGAAPDRGRRLRRLAVPFWIVMLVVAIWRVLAVAPPSLQSPLGLLERVMTFCGVYVGYLAKLVAPLGLSVSDTVTRFSALGSAGQLGVIVSFAGLATVQLFAFLRLPKLRVWILLYNLSLLPVAQLVPILHFRADRFLYLPSLAFAGAVVALAARVVRGLSPGRARRAAVALGLVALTVYAGLALRRVGRLATDESLFGHEVARTPDYLEGLCALARASDRRGEHQRAEELYRRCLERRPERVSFMSPDEAVVNLSANLLAQDRPADAWEAIAAFESSVRLPEARLELAYNRGVAAFKMGAFAPALALLGDYARSRPEDADCQYLIGVAALELGLGGTATRAFRAYLELRPEAPDRREVERLLTEAAAGGASARESAPAGEGR